MDEYDRIHAWFVATRSQEVGVAEVEALAAALPQGAQVLDLGCGDGRPLGQVLRSYGCDLYGIDSSRRMIEGFRRHCVGAHTECAQLQTSTFFNTLFHAIIAWSVLFHLDAAEQEAAIAKVATHLLPGGTFLFTAGEAAGVAESSMHRVKFRYLSLGAERYQAILSANGLGLVERHTDAWDNHVFLAVKE